MGNPPVQGYPFQHPYWNEQVSAHPLSQTYLGPQFQAFSHPSYPVFRTQQNVSRRVDQPQVPLLAPPPVSHPSPDVNAYLRGEELPGPHNTYKVPAATCPLEEPLMKDRHEAL